MPQEHKYPTNQELDEAIEFNQISIVTQCTIGKAIHLLMPVTFFSVEMLIRTIFRSWLPRRKQRRPYDLLKVTMRYFRIIVAIR